MKESGLAANSDTSSWNTGHLDFLKGRKRADLSNFFIYMVNTRWKQWLARLNCKSFCFLTLEISADVRWNKFDIKWIFIFLCSVKTKQSNGTLEKTRNEKMKRKHILHKIISWQETLKRSCGKSRESLPHTILHHATCKERIMKKEQCIEQYSCLWVASSASETKFMTLR